MRYTAVASGLTLTLSYVKNWLKVDDDTDDTLITDLTTIAKEQADDYLQNDFKTILNQQVGIGDDSTVTFTLANIPVEDLSLKLWIFPEGTDMNIARGNPVRYGQALLDQSTNNIDGDYTLNLTTGVITFNSSGVPDQGEIIWATRYRITTAESIPNTIKMAVLKQIGYCYEHRTGGIKSEAVKGLGSVSYGSSGLPIDVERMLAPYRKLPGT